MRSAVILAGGEGRRMGAEKASVMLCGRPLIEHVIERILDAVDEVVVVLRDYEQARRLEGAVSGCRVAIDHACGIGPLAGLQTGMNVARGRYAFATGCDMPFLNSDIIDGLFSVADGHDGAVPILNDIPERLHAVYLARQLEDACRIAIARGERRISAPLAWLDIKFVDAEIFRDVDPELLSFFNVNTPDDLRSAEDIVRKRTAERHSGLP
ncbi:MAG: molybdenum cofactor guanylyltransferase [Methanothrix sp.]|jgi:molybdopterin-guanine dinucleotide biosynthesis protein A|uniref:Probable molybdenum cofactor guanylyltransferase n=1 Tax=Methanothrix thermoacetophila (strain DSM 6194 / JCM 14653 / NBRC 101360 / PT) TaxID=349307 RepID=A0B8J9_METTP|nr:MULTISPECIES: molybdenum cofactor guanylyltransferase [Methanothrix]ABK15023.1 molybdenum cofactor guanylyltransferase [Methanothrix thermoacetophila PT]MBC7079395.1 molybdenum cofactor guanylyltransferase [Methanothrix sp.]NPU86862.1 molybdenum cofactor guanylyltransferase [Methanothrix sp.]